MRTVCVALPALAADWLDYIIEVFVAVMVGHFLPGLDVSFRPNPDASACDHSFCVWPAGVINIARHVAAWTAVDRRFGVDTEEIFAVTLVNLFIGYDWTGVLDDPRAFRNRFCGEEP